MKKVMKLLKLACIAYNLGDEDRLYALHRKLPMHMDIDALTHYEWAGDTLPLLSADGSCVGVSFAFMKRVWGLDGQCLFIPVRTIPVFLDSMERDMRKVKAFIEAVAKTF